MQLFQSTFYYGGEFNKQIGNIDTLHDNICQVKLIFHYQRDGSLQCQNNLIMSVTTMERATIGQTREAMLIF